MDLILAFSLQDQVEKYGAYVGLAAFLGLAVLSLLYFAQARELKRLRDWAGRAPERALELEAKVVAQAEDALREAEPEVPAAAAASGNGRQAAAIPMGPRPAVAVAAAAARARAANATVDAPAVPASTDGEVPDDAAVVAAAGGGAVAPPVEDHVAVPVADGGGVAPVEDDAATSAGDGGAVPPPGDDEAAVPVAAGGAVAPPGEDRDEPAGEPPGDADDDDRGAAATGDDEALADEDRAPEQEPARSGNGVPAAPPTQIPRATPRPQPRPVPAAPLRAATPSRAAPPPRRAAPRRKKRERGSRAGLYVLLGVLVLAAAVAVPVYLMVTNDDEPAPQPNPIAEPGGTPAAAGGGGAQASENRPEKVVVVLNGTPIDGLASRERDTLLTAGYSDEQGMIRIDNNQDQACQDSIVYFGAEERRQARDVSRLLDITRTEQIDDETQALADSSDESGTLPADVVALLCADKSP